MRRRRRRRHELVDVEPPRGKLPDGPERRVRERATPAERRASRHHADVVVDVVAVVVQLFDQLQHVDDVSERRRPQAAAAEQRRKQRQIRSAGFEPGSGEPMDGHRPEQDRHRAGVPDQPRVKLLPGCSDVPRQLSHEEENIVRLNQLQLPVKQKSSSCKIQVFRPGARTIKLNGSVLSCNFSKLACFYVETF